MNTSLMRCLKQSLVSLALALCMVLPWHGSQADDLDIYTNPAQPLDQAPITMLALDLNLLDVGALACTNILLPQPAPPQIPDAPNVDCFGLQQLLTVGQLFDVLGALPGNLTGGVTGVLISTLPGSVLNQSLATALQAPGLLTPIFNTLGSVLASNDLLGTLTSTLPVYLALSNILRGLVDSRVGIMLNHSDQSAAPAPGRCGFLDESSLGGERQDTPACSNGGYIFLGLVDPTRVDQLLTKLLPLLTGAVGNLRSGGTNVSVGGSGSVGSGGTNTGLVTGGLLSQAPYQTKELYAEFMAYLTGGPSYNAKLDVYDNVLAKALARDQTAEVETSNHRNYVSALQRFPQACNINMLHVQLTPAAEQDDSDNELRRLLPEVQRDGTLSLAAVVNAAANEGFVYNNDRRRINSFFLVQEAVGNLGDLTAVRGLGSNVTTYSNLLGLIGRGRDIAGAMINPLSVDTTLSSLAIAASRSTASGTLQAAYLPAFRADNEKKPDWPGNLKRLQLRPKTTDPKLSDVIDARSAVALASTGRISNNALTLWTDETRLGSGISADGPVADLGGAGQNIPGFQQGGGGNPGRSNPAAPSTTTRTLYFDSYVGAAGARLAALDPDVAAVRSELATATSASGFSAGNSACSASCNSANSTCLNQCGGNQSSCNNICVGTQNTCNSSCGIGQANCAAGCGTDLNSCVVAANSKKTNCNNTAASDRAQCEANAQNAQAMCVAPAALVRTTCNTLAATNRTTCNTGALTRKTARDVLCLGNATCLTNSNNTYNADLAACTATFNADTTTCTTNYNNSVAPCTAAYNNSITQCTNTFNGATAQCTATHTSEVNACNATNDSCTSTCSGNASSCGLTCGVDANSCSNICTGNNTSCNNSCSAQLGSCQAACGVDTTRTPDTEVKELLLYARGFDVGTLANPKGSGSTPATKTDSGISSRPWMMGAVLHSKPVAINYGKRVTGSSSDDVRVVFGSADGYLRMVRDDTGVESWGFMPQAVMSNLRVLRENVAGSALPYGVDGSPMVLIRDRPKNGVSGIIGDVVSDPNATPPVIGDRVLVFFGLRRGGDAYYALDVTNPDAPQLVWKLSSAGLHRGGQTAVDGGTESLFKAMGLTFSNPQVARIRYDVDGVTTTPSNTDVETRTALIFGGGYHGSRIVAGSKVLQGKDLNNTRAAPLLQVGRDDGSGATTASDRGNALFMIQADTGKLLWQVTRSPTAAASYDAASRSYAHPMMVDSIPSDVTAIDSNNDGFTDRLYVGDTGGRLWRADFASALTSAWTMTPIASVGRHNPGNGDVANDRRIFFAPDYVPIRNAANRQGSDIIMFGTGDREDPFNLATENWFYAIRDTDLVSGKPASEIVVTEEDDRLPKHTTGFTDFSSTGGSVGDITKLPTAGYRFKYSRSGEKHFSAPITLGGVSTFTSYVPPDTSVTSTRLCTPSEGVSRLYSILFRDSKFFAVHGASDSGRDVSLGTGLPGEINALSGKQQAAGGLIYAIPAKDIYRASWRERLGETQK